MPKFLNLEVAVEMVLTDEADTINILPPKEDQLLTDREDFDDEDLTVIENNVSIDARNMPSDACGRVDEENRLLQCESEAKLSSRKKRSKEEKDRSWQMLPGGEEQI